MINSFLGNDVLPTSIEPTTALNTYVVYDDQDEKDELYIRNHFSGRTKIDESLYDFVTHSFSNEYHQNVRSMIRYVSLHTKKLNFRNIALLDTPGYTGESSDLSLEEDDKNMAIEGIKGADYVIWVIDITNGTIKEDDIDFLDSYANDKPKVIVLNKADLLPKSRREEVYNNVKNILEEEGLDNIAIYLYSSLYPEDFEDTSNMLFKVFKDVDDGVKDESIEDIKELFKSFEEYYKDIEKDLALETEIANLAKMQIGMKLNDKLNNINMSLSKIKKHRNDIDFIIKELKRVCIEMDSFIVKAIPNFKSKKSTNKNLNKNSINEKNKSYSSVDESALSKGIEYNKLFRYDDAIIELERLIPAYSKSFNLWHQLGIAYSGIKDYKKTIEVLTKAIEINPKYHDSWRILAWAYSENGQYTEALFALNKSTTLSI